MLAEVYSTFLHTIGKNDLTLGVLGNLFFCFHCINESKKVLSSLAVLGYIKINSFMTSKLSVK